MIASTANFGTRPPVRWPFRAIAAVVCIAGVAAVFAVLWSVWSHDATSRPLSGLIGLPGMLMIVRVAYHAAVRRCAPATICWPFASDRVVFWYFVVLVCVDIFAKHGG
jgi:hypothetical protein